jgi:hypothetical protein
VTLLLFALYFCGVPDSAPKEFESLLCSTMPEWALYPLGREESSASAGGGGGAEASQSPSLAAALSSASSHCSEKTAFSGVWKRVSTDANFVRYLQAQGVGYLNAR